MISPQCLVDALDGREENWLLVVLQQKRNTMNILANVKQALKRRAVLQKEIDAIDRMFAQFGDVKLGASRLGGGPRKRKHMSAAAKAKLSAVAKARWKKAKASGKRRL